jgi:hypothetical protein
MELDDYLRYEAARYRDLATQARNLQEKDGYLDLARVCEEVANHVEEHLTPG